MIVAGYSVIANLMTINDSIQNGSLSFGDKILGKMANEVSRPLGSTM